MTDVCTTVHVIDRTWMERYGVALVTSLLLLATGCSNGQETESAGDLEALLQAASFGSGVDYEPLTGPEHAKKQADVIVSGTLVDIGPGLEIRDDGGSAGRAPRPVGLSFVSFSIAVDELLWQADPAMNLPSELQVQVVASSRVDPEHLAQLNPRPAVVVALDVTPLEFWTEQGLTVTPHNGADGRVAFMPFEDLFWFDDGTGAQSMRVDGPADLAPGWGSISSVADLVAALR